MSINANRLISGDSCGEDIHEGTGHQVGDCANLLRFAAYHWHQGCYLYTPRTVDEEGGQRPSKRRKTAPLATGSEIAADCFPALLSGHENVKHVQRRQIAFRRCWAETASRIAHSLEAVNTAILGEVVQFVKDAPLWIDHERLPTGIISCGPKAGSETNLLEQWKSTQAQSSSAIVVSLDSPQAATLMIALKNLIRAAITQVDGADGYQTFLDERKRRIYMNYDLELLQEFVNSSNIQKCVVHLADTEAFDMAVLIDLISVIRAWRDRIPFVLLLGISTTVDLFEARLPKSTIRLLDCRLFDTSTGADPCLEMYQSLHHQSQGLSISLGPIASGALFEMSREQDAGATSFSQAIKYAIMSHFFANALSISLEPDTGDVNTDSKLCEAIRTTDSFRTYVEEMLNGGNAEGVRDLFYDDKALLDAAREAVRNGQKAMSQHLTAVELFVLVLNLLNPSEIPLDPFSIHVQALSGPSFLDSTLFTDLISRITTLSSDRMRKMLDTIQQHNSPAELDLNTLLNRLNHIAPINTKIPLRTAYDPTHATTSTTITNNKVSLSKHGPNLSAKETEYTRLVDQITDTLFSHFETNIHNPTTLFMHEAFAYDLKSPLAIAFTPRPRYATERALSTPYDYLGCECCEGQASGHISATQPATSILWQLWCEAGGIVNVRDLWNAFEAIVVDRQEDDDDDDYEESTRGKGDVEAAKVTGAVDGRMALALFYRGLAELRMMGFVKGTKRKVDCLAKTAWRGL